MSSWKQEQETEEEVVSRVTRQLRGYSINLEYWQEATRTVGAPWAIDKNTTRQCVYIARHVPPTGRVIDVGLLVEMWRDCFGGNNSWVRYSETRGKAFAEWLEMPCYRDRQVWMDRRAAKRAGESLDGYSVGNPLDDRDYTWDDSAGTETPIDAPPEVGE